MFFPPQRTYSNWQVLQLRSNFKSVKPKTVHSPLFFRKMVAIERFALQAAILDECQNHLEGGERLGAEERKIEGLS